MSRRHSQRRFLRSAHDARDFQPANKQAGGKKMQLCKQVQEALTWALGSSTGHERLSYCTIADVEPLLGGNRLLVKVSVPPDLAISEVTNELAAATPALRMEVAQAITRRKAPELVFLPLPAG